MNLMLGTMVGLAAGLGLALLIENLDTTLRTIEDVKTTTACSILGQIPVIKSTAKTGGAVIFPGDGFSPPHDAYRRLRTNILALNSESESRTLLATSALRGEGKSVVVANLASTFAEVGQRIVVVDADLHLPTLHKLFDLPNDIGLTSVLTRQVALEDAIQQARMPNLYILTSGPQVRNPSELLCSVRTRETIEQLSRQFDKVLIDTPCLLSVTDGAVLGPMADSVMLVVSQGHSRRETVHAALGQLADVKANTIGLVINRAEQTKRYYGRNGYHGRRSKPERPRPRSGVESDGQEQQVATEG